MSSKITLGLYFFSIFFISCSGLSKTQKIEMSKAIKKDKALEIKYKKQIIKYNKAVDKYNLTKAKYD
ncbi:MAG: hypothetical protein OXJ52_01265 [Oligoflexia bacterium]|nr:hypothetical protein [Oligoflexia bacterium]